MKFGISVLIIFYFNGALSLHQSALIHNFTDDFSFGVATSAYQVEGAWNTSGKGTSFWDFITHNRPEIIDDRNNGDVACDSYHKIDEDIKLLQDLGVDHYRFSIAWTRILPNGLENQINSAGVAYYDELITKLLAAGIEPWVTIYHFDHPYGVHLLGGWFQPKIADYLASYADILFSKFGDKVKTWITINEPYSICIGLIEALGPDIPRGIAEYICGQNILKAHLNIWEVYNKKYRAKQKGKLSMAVNLQAHLPATDTPEDIEAVERLNQFAFGWFVHPLIFGNYPKIMIDTIAKYSEEQGYTESRLPSLSPTDLDKLKGAYDYIGLNIYDTFLVSADNETIDKTPTYENDCGAKFFEPEWNTSYTIEMRAKGFGVVLNWIKNTYGNPEIRITEQGYPEDESDKSDLADVNRRSFLLASMKELLHAINIDKVKVTGYTFWSFMDNFEWNRGYTKKYGLYYVDFDGESRRRIPRFSSETFASITNNRTLQGLV
ncbi:unnamed protein product [Psylliodes chrysocephalus]|uniref:Myrosinase 1-like n=1 Tax=Psylliodes chrysocephalus TaxID=3402493 RepID=A0A9P0CF80_9CUCU|nr:unnamed protein product [Psylliodes chrysocephala]